jgi:phosphoribosylformylglycinamidine synthase subunit PurQ / glutaminase
LVRIGITVFPGSNCDRDVYHILNNILHVDANYIWYKSSFEDFDCVIIPGGFTYGDRLRAGTIAAHSPIMDKIKELADDNVPILGICNGFQILVESGILPGALIVNESLNFICKWINVVITNTDTPFTNLYYKKQRISIPIAHGEGRFMIDNKSYNKIKKKNQITLEYQEHNPNGSLNRIAAICNQKGNVMGMMPHPERGSDKDLIPAGYDHSSILIFKSMINYFK